MRYDCAMNRMRFASWLEKAGYMAIAKSFRVSHLRGKEFDSAVWEKYEQWLVGELLYTERIFETGPAVGSKVKKLLNMSEKQLQRVE